MDEVFGTRNAGELGDLLRARRGWLCPRAVGLELGGRRKVAGLRREVLALDHGPESVSDTTRRLRRVMNTRAVVLGRHLDLLAWNSMAEGLLGDPAGYPSGVRGVEPRSLRRMDH